MRTVPTLPTVLGRVILAELRKLAASRLAWAGWLFLLGITALTMLGVDAVAVNADPQLPVARTLPAGLAWTLGVRNFYLAQLWLVVLTASSFAGEYATRTLREDVVTAVPRWGILLGKWVALGAWSAVSLIGHTLVGIVFGLGALEVGDGWGGWAWALLGSLGADVGFVAFALLVAVLARRVAPAIVAAVLFMGLERAFAGALAGVAMLDQSMVDMVMPGVPLHEIARAVLPWMPATAWAMGTAFATGETVTATTLGAFFGWTTLFAAATTALFERLDVP